MTSDCPGNYFEVSERLIQKLIGYKVDTYRQTYVTTGKNAILRARW